MTLPFVLPLKDCHDPALAGGKAVGLGRLIQLGFRVPSGLCLTTAAYHDALHRAGIDVRKEWESLRAAPDNNRPPLLESIRRGVMLAVLPENVYGELEQQLSRLHDGVQSLWAVRSSCSEEDGQEATFGGLFQTFLRVPRSELSAAIARCWASLWTLPAWQYRMDISRGRPTHALPQMAVVLQPLLHARAAGVMYSNHPVTGNRAHVVIDAVRGLAEPLVSGQVTPDHYVVTTDLGPDNMTVTERLPAGEPGTVGEVSSPTLDDKELLALARLAKQVESGFGRAMDIEWVLADDGLWLLQARPIPRVASHNTLTQDVCLWSRANFRETLPEVPSPLAVAWLQEYMETNILAHYRKLGCEIPAGVSAVRIVHGRPYINVTLNQALVIQLGGDANEVTDLMGGESVSLPKGMRRLPVGRLLRATLLLGWQIHKAPKLAPAWFARLKELGSPQPALEASLNEQELLDRLVAMNEVVRKGDLTFAAVAAVSQAFWMLRLVLQPRLKESWRSVLNAATQGFGSVISARQILWLVELAELAGRDPKVREFFLEKTWRPQLDLNRLAGTPFLAELDRFLGEYGHRAIGESDISSPRFAEQPGYVLDIIRGHLLKPTPSSPSVIQEEQARSRAAALRQIRKAFGWRLHRWWWFLRWHRSLCRSQSLREANRHTLMYYVDGMKRILVRLGTRLVERCVLESVDDVFFLTPDELRIVVAELALASRRDWKPVVSQRRARMEQDKTFMPPDLLVGAVGVRAHVDMTQSVGQPSDLTGMAVSAGYAEGPIRVLRTAEDYSRVECGDILVMHVLDPGIAPLMGLAGGLIVEMGGMLSHGAIIAREYGIPALANVRQAMVLLKDGERVELDAKAGEVRRMTQT